MPKVNAMLPTVETAARTSMSSMSSTRSQSKSESSMAPEATTRSSLQASPLRKTMVSGSIRRSRSTELKRSMNPSLHSDMRDTLAIIGFTVCLDTSSCSVMGRSS